MEIRDGIVYNADGVRVGKLVNGAFQPNAVYDAVRDGVLELPEKPKEMDDKPRDATA